MSFKDMERYLGMESVVVGDLMEVVKLLIWFLRIVLDMGLMRCESVKG
ncbi:MAG: hypothetical protein N2712_03495 [Brevinematales bacterium]|nr:hypothetical protein [Brevinematales bacterium]